MFNSSAHCRRKVQVRIRINTLYGGVPIMRDWIDLVESLLNRKFDKAKYERELQQAQEKIDWEEQHVSEAIPTSVRSVPHVDDTEAWDAYWADFDWEYEKLKKRQATKKAKKQRKLELEQQARIEGVRLTAKDAMDDMIEQDKELVRKLAQQTMKSSQRQIQRIKKMADRQLKD